MEHEIRRKKRNKVPFKVKEAASTVPASFGCYLVKIGFSKTSNEPEPEPEQITSFLFLLDRRHSIELTC